MLPVFKKTYTFPLGTKIKNVDCNPICINSKVISEKIKPSSNIWYIPYLNGTTVVKNSSYEIFIEDDEYSSSNLFPAEWYNYTIKCGLDGNENVVFLILDVYPIKYSPLDNTIFYPVEFEIQINYEEPENFNSFCENYDMLIIAPSKFERALQPFIQHKNKFGISTIFKTTDEIFKEFAGRDEPEQIKYFIKYAKEQWGVEYVLLVGGLKSYIYAKDKDSPNHGSSAWYVPVRYTNTDEGIYNKGCISDLYYADVYKYDDSKGYSFEDWDSNENNILAEGNYTCLEKIDLCPDVHVGRLPCRNVYEVRTVVKKIINYESTPSENKSWFKKMISISGNAGTITDGKPDCEILSDKAIEYMEDYVEPVRIYASNRGVNKLVPKVDVVTKEISKGAGFVHFIGHGSTISWFTLWPDCKYGSENMTTGIHSYALWRLSNKNKLPIAVISGCCTSLFNVTLIKSILSSRFGNKNYYMTQGIPAFGCLCWRFVVKPNGGAIATIGTTATEKMSLIPYVPRGFSFNSELDINFFNQIGKNNVKTFGNAYSGAITKSIKENPIRSYEMHCIMQWQCFADPSLKIGGYN